MLGQQNHPNQQRNPENLKIQGKQSKVYPEEILSSEINSNQSNTLSGNSKINLIDQSKAQKYDSQYITNKQFLQKNQPSNQMQIEKKNVKFFKQPVQQKQETTNENLGINLTNNVKFNIQKKIIPTKHFSAIPEISQPIKDNQQKQFFEQLEEKTNHSDNQHRHQSKNLIPSSKQSSEMDDDNLLNNFSDLSSNTSQRSSFHSSQSSQNIKNGKIQKTQNNLTTQIQDEDQLNMTKIQNEGEQKPINKISSIVEISKGQSEEDFIDEDLIKRILDLLNEKIPLSKINFINKDFYDKVLLKPVTFKNDQCKDLFSKYNNSLIQLIDKDKDDLQIHNQDDNKIQTFYNYSNEELQTYLDNLNNLVNFLHTSNEMAVQNIANDLINLQDQTKQFIPKEENTLEFIFEKPQFLGDEIKHEEDFIDSIKINNISNLLNKKVPESVINTFNKEFYDKVMKKPVTFKNKQCQDLFNNYNDTLENLINKDVYNEDTNSYQFNSDDLDNYLTKLDDLNNFLQQSNELGIQDIIDILNNLKKETSKFVKNNDKKIEPLSELLQLGNLSQDEEDLIDEDKINEILILLENKIPQSKLNTLNQNLYEKVLKKPVTFKQKDCSDLLNQYNDSLYKVLDRDDLEMQVKNDDKVQDFYQFDKNDFQKYIKDLNQLVDMLNTSNEADIQDLILDLMNIKNQADSFIVNDVKVKEPLSKNNQKINSEQSIEEISESDEDNQVPRCDGYDIQTPFCQLKKQIKLIQELLNEKIPLSQINIHNQEFYQEILNNEDKLEDEDLQNQMKDYNDYLIGLLNQNSFQMDKEDGKDQTVNIYYQFNNKNLGDYIDNLKNLQSFFDESQDASLQDIGSKLNGLNDAIENFKKEEDDSLEFLFSKNIEKSSSLISSRGSLVSQKSTKQKRIKRRVVVIEIIDCGDCISDLKHLTKSLLEQIK